MKRRLFTGGKILVSTFLIIIIFKKVGLDDLVVKLTDIGLYFLVATVFALGFTMLKAYKWYYLLRLISDKVKFSTAVKSYLLGMSFGLLTPGRVGETARFINLEEKRKGLVVGLVGVDKISDLFAVSFLSLFGVYYFFGPAMLVLMSLILLSLIMVTVWPNMLLSRLSILNRVLPAYSAKLGDFIKNVNHIEPSSLTKFGIVTLFSYLVVMVEYYFLVLDFEAVEAVTIVLVHPLVMLTNILPISIGGLGVREGAASILFSEFSVSSSTAVNSSFLLFFLNTFLPAIIGSIFVTR